MLWPKYGDFNCSYLSKYLDYRHETHMDRFVQKINSYSLSWFQYVLIYLSKNSRQNYSTPYPYSKCQIFVTEETWLAKYSDLCTSISIS